MAHDATGETPFGTEAAVWQPGAAAQPDTLAGRVRVTTTHRIAEVEQVWRDFAAAGVESPGQSFDFIRLWTTARDIPEAEQLYVVGALDGRPLALLPLQRRRRHGIRLYSWFAGKHVGCSAPLVDTPRLAALSPAERAAFWAATMRQIRGADVVYLAAIPEAAAGSDALFAGLGTSLPVETLYRAEFPSWEAANTTQRSKSRRKHDRQQGEKLDALGRVDFEVVGNGEAARPVLDEMFRQRARRFAAMGVRDPFAPCDVARFYNQSVAAGSGVEVKLHVLRLDGAVVAVRYNVVQGDRLFCLISSMSDDCAIQVGSPGKQCLLRVMQTAFDEGYRTFDMGAGLTDEKRHWCNVQVPLRSHYVPLSPLGRAIVAAHALWLATRARIKSDRRLMQLVKNVRGRFAAVSAKSAAPPPAEASE